MSKKKDRNNPPDIGGFASTGSLDIEVERIGLVDATTGRVVHEARMPEGAVRIRGELLGTRKPDGAIHGNFAGHLIENSPGFHHRHTLTADASISGFDKKGKGRPNTLDRDIALRLAVMYEIARLEEMGSVPKLDAIYAELSKDKGWKLLSELSLKNAARRGDEELESECIGCALYPVPFDAADEPRTALVAVCFTKKQARVVSADKDTLVYYGYPWIWQKGTYRLVRDDRMTPLEVHFHRGAPLFVEMERFKNRKSPD
ncbi:MAG: hypothetical protein KA260_01705 [Burkholderiales bacterium]|nr:hypothetical protein [Burkholderiales bacterium]